MRALTDILERIAQNWRFRASRHHRSLQGELLVILENAASRSPAPSKILSKIQALGLETWADSVNMIRSDRDAH